MSKNQNGKKKHKGLRTFLLVLLILLLLLLLAGGAGYLYVRHIYGDFLDPNAPEIVEEPSSNAIVSELPSDVVFTSEKPSDAISGEWDPNASSGAVSDEPSETSETSDPAVTSEKTSDGGKTEGGKTDSGKTEGGGSSSGKSGGGKTQEGPDTGYMSNGDTKVPIYKKDPIDPDIVNILLMGIDVEDLNRKPGRSDSMILVSYNTKTGVVKMYSIMRDCLVSIKGHGTTKLNHSYAYGREGLCINTINNHFGTDIQQYATIDWSGLREIVNHMGGIWLPLTQQEIDYYGWTTMKPGLNHLRGDQVKRHVSNRTLGDDYQRGRRQRDVLLSIYNQLMNDYSVSEIIDFLKFASGSIKTNIPFETTVSYATSIYANRANVKIESLQVPFKGTYTGGWAKCPEGTLSVCKIDIAANRRMLLKDIYG